MILVDVLSYSPLRTPLSGLANSIGIRMTRTGEGFGGKISLNDGSIDVYRKKKQWNAASLSHPVIPPRRSYRKLKRLPTDRWPVFPTLDQRKLAGLVQEELADRGEQSDAIEERRDEYARDLLLALDEGIRPPSIRQTAPGRFSNDSQRLRRLTSTIRNMTISHNTMVGEALVRAFGYTVAAPRYLDNSEEMVRERYSHIETGEPGNVATDALNEVNCVPES